MNTGTATGDDTVQAVATISGMGAGSNLVAVHWNPPSGPAAPSGATPGYFSSPIHLTQVSGVVPIILNTSVTNTTVDYWPAADPSAVVVLVANGSASAGQAITNFDTTTVANGSYFLRIQNSQLTSLVEVTVVGEYKPGRLTATVTDLRVPLVGIPITIQRTYDSLERSKSLDFGYGWSLGVYGPRLEVDPYYNVTFTFQGRRATFRFTPQSQGFPFFYLTTPAYTPEPGTYGTLTSDGCGLLYLTNGTVSCFPDFSRYQATTYTYTDPRGRQYVMGADSKLKSIRDLNGNTLTVTADGITASVGGVAVPFLRDGSGRITQITDPNRKLFQYHYDTAGNLDTVTLPDIATPVRYTYDPSFPHLLSSETDPRGHSATSLYYPDGRLKSVTRPISETEQETTQFVYDVMNRITTQTNPDTGVVVTQYDSFGMPLQILEDTGYDLHVTTYTYYPDHNVETRTDGLGKTTKFTYDANGNRTSVENVNLHEITSAEYNQVGQPVTITDALQTPQTLNYDAHFNLLSISDGIGTLGSSTWDSLGNLLTFTDANGKTTHWDDYDAMGNPQTQTDPLQRVVRFTYDAMGRVLTRKDARQHTTQYTYDALGNLKTITYPATATQPATTRQFDYDGNGNRITQIDAYTPPRTTRYEYDFANRLKKVTYPDMTTVQYTRDFRGNVKIQTDQAGRVTHYQYDFVGQLRSVTYAEGTPDAATVSYQYDLAGRRIRGTDELGRTTDYEYDAADRLKRIVRRFGFFLQFSRITEYTYDAAGRRTSVKENDQPATQFGYDIRGRLKTITYPATATQPMTTQQFDYDGAGRQKVVTDQPPTIPTTTTMTTAS